MTNVLSVRVLLPGLNLLGIQLSDGKRFVRDLGPFIRRAPGILQKLRKKSFFGRVRVVDGVITWPGGIDIAPETLIGDGRPFTFVR